MRLPVPSNRILVTFVCIHSPNQMQVYRQIVSMFRILYACRSQVFYYIIHRRVCFCKFSIFQKKGISTISDYLKWVSSNNLRFTCVFYLGIIYFSCAKKKFPHFRDINTTRFFRQLYMMRFLQYQKVVYLNERSEFIILTLEKMPKESKVPTFIKL